MKIFMINSVPYGSTGRIMYGIKNLAESCGHEVKMACGYSYHPIQEMAGKYEKIGNIFGKLFHNVLTKITGKHAVYSKGATKKLIKKIKAFNPDVVHLHNLHSGYLDVRTLFKYLKETDVKVIMTLHDCWTFTGHCPHFTMVGCDKWKYGCYKCVQHKAYPSAYVDGSKKMYNIKKQAFTGVRDLTIVTPSKWLADLVSQSFLKNYPIKVINNGINLEVFRPRKSDVKQQLGLLDKFIVIGVTYKWDKRKGLDRIIDLAKRLDDKYRIILVGTDDEVDKVLPNNVISVHRTENATRLAELYSIANVFFNPTREDNFPTVNLEALACGVPVVTYNTGGSPECIDKTCGMVIESQEQALRAISVICEQKIFKVDKCIKRAEIFNEKIKFVQYVNLYCNV